MHFLQLLGRLARNDSMVVSSSKITRAIQRNMNGAERAQMTEILSFFVKPFETIVINDDQLINPLELMLESIREKRENEAPVGRYVGTYSRLHDTPAQLLRIPWVLA